MNIHFIFRTECRDFTTLDNEILSKLIKHKDETAVTQNTPYGLAILARTIMSVSASVYSWMNFQRS